MMERTLSWVLCCCRLGRDYVEFLENTGGVESYRGDLLNVQEAQFLLNPFLVHSLGQVMAFILGDRSYLFLH